MGNLQDTLRAMKKVIITERVASLIERLKVDEGYNAEMAYLCQAFAEVGKHITRSEEIDDDLFIPMEVLARYRDLLNELSHSELTNT